MGIISEPVGTSDDERLVGHNKRMRTSRGSLTAIFHRLTSYTCETPAHHSSALASEAPLLAAAAPLPEALRVVFQSGPEARNTAANSRLLPESNPHKMGTSVLCSSVCRLRVAW